MMGGKVLFADHFFPQLGDPPCDDPVIIEWLESSPAFGKQIFLHSSDERPPDIKPESIPEGSTATVEDLSAAVVQLQRMGIEVNPALLKKASEEKETEVVDEPAETPEPDEGEPVVNTLPTLTFVASARKELLQGIIEKQGWDDLNKEGTVTYLRDAIRGKVKEAQQTQ